MGPSRTRAGAAPSGLFAALLFCATFAGCEHYCLVVQSNPGGTINTNTSCPATTSTGNVTLTFGSSVASASATDALSAPPRSPHIFVTLRGIDALPASIPGDDAAAWQPLAPQLAFRPVQVDLNARPITGPPGPRLGEPGENSPGCEIIEPGALTGPPGRWLIEPGGSVVPAGVYSQLRLRLVQNLDPNSGTNPPANQPSDRSTLAAPPLDASACGANLFNCLIPPDAAALPLAFGDSAEIVIPSDRIAGGFIRVLPDSSVRLSIAFDAVLSHALPAGNALRLIPVFSASTRSCYSSE